MHHLAATHNATALELLAEHGASLTVLTRDGRSPMELLLPDAAVRRCALLLHSAPVPSPARVCTRILTLQQSSDEEDGGGDTSGDNGGDNDA